jgi:hypothetical protein
MALATLRSTRIKSKGSMRFFSKSPGNDAKPSHLKAHTGYTRDRHSQGNSFGFTYVFVLATGLGVLSGVAMAKCEENNYEGQPR